MKLPAIFALTLASFIVLKPSFADYAIKQDASIQTRKGQVRGGTCATNAYTGSKTIFGCTTLGEATIEDIYNQGWRVVSTIMSPRQTGYITLIIEEQR